MTEAERIKVMNEKLMTLLDLIENETDSYDIQKMTRMRFDIAKDCGFTVEFGGESSSAAH